MLRGLVYAQRPLICYTRRGLLSASIYAYTNMYIYVYIYIYIRGDAVGTRADVPDVPEASPGPSAEATHSTRPRMVRQMDGAFAGLLHVTVHKISTAAFMDFTDSYVSLQLGSDEQKTSCKNNVRPPLFCLQNI